MRVPVLGLGTAPLHRPADAEAIATVARALTEGSNIIDTVPLYGAGRASRW